MHTAENAPAPLSGTTWVRIGSPPGVLHALEPLLRRVEAAAGDVVSLLALAEETGRSVPVPGEGNTAHLWEILASVAAVDVGAARVFEPHLDATAILAQAGESTVLSGTWGVFAAEGAGTRLNARAVGDRILLSGSKPWCSLAGILGSAIVTGTTEGQARQAFIVDLRSPGVSVDNPRWTSNGLREIPSGTVHFRDVPATPLGEPGWYFARPGFAWGGMGVAACWLGGAAGLLRDFKAALLKKEPDQIAHAGLGEADRLLSGALEMLSASAARIDDGSLDNNSWPEALRVRGNAVAVVERIQAIVSENLGPGPLAFDRRYAKRMADLSLYVRQHHGMRDDAQLGKLVMEDPTRW